MNNDTNMGTNSCRQTDFEEALNAFVDGILSTDDQVTLFEHLAGCTQCRSELDAIMTFRRISRQEYISVPPAVDDEFYKKLAAHKSQDINQSDVDRSVLAANVPMSLRTIILAASVVFLIGFFIPGNMTSADTKVVETRQERVNLASTSATSSMLEAVYVFYPGLTVTADQLPEEVERSFYINSQIK